MKKKKYPTSLLILALLGALFLYVKFFEKGAKKEEGQVQLFALDEKNITKIVVRKGKQETILTKENDAWMLLPKNVLAKKDAVAGILVELADFTAERRLSDNLSLKDLKVFGLDKPKYSFTAFQGNAEAASVVFGDSAPVGGVVYMKEDKKPSAYTMQSYRAEKFNKAGESDFREKKLLFFDTDKITGVSVKGKSAEFDFEREGQDWSETKPQNKRMKGEVQDVVNDLQSLEAKNFAEDHPKDLKLYSLDTPLFLITLRGDGKERTLSVNKKGKDVFVLSSDNPSVAVIGDDAVKKIQDAVKKAKEVEKKETNTGTKVQSDKGAQSKK